MHHSKEYVRYFALPDPLVNMLPHTGQYYIYKEKVQSDNLSRTVKARGQEVNVTTRSSY